MATKMKTDTDITADVVAELAWDPTVTAGDLEADTSNGQVTLSGTTDTYFSKDAAEDAAYRVAGVRGVTNDILVDAALYGERSDADIQADIISALTLDMLVPLDQISVDVNDGFVTLSGNLEYFYQREAAEDDAGQIAGVLGIVDEITVTPPDMVADNVADSIADAFARNAELLDDNVTVTVDGSTAKLGGSVSTWSEYFEAEDAAWRAPGVGNVINNIFVTY